MDRRNWSGRINNEKSSTMGPRTWVTGNNGGKSSYKYLRICDCHNIEKTPSMDRRNWAGDVIEKPSSIDEYPQDKEGYDYYTLIGGGDGIVNDFKAICRPLDSCLVAIKIVDIERAKVHLDYAFARSKIMTYLRHPNILHAHCTFTDTRCLWVVMPFIPAGSFQSIVSELYPEGLREHYIAAILYQVLCGLQYLHSEGLTHGNIKPGNILIDCEGVVMLADLVSTAVNHDCDPSRNDDETPAYWIAPESRNRAWSPESDMWAFGITALELAYGNRVPLSQKPTSKSLLKKIGRRYRNIENYDKENSDFRGCYLSGAFRDMLCWCLYEDPSQRPSAEELMTHPFFNNCHTPMFLIEDLLMDLPNDVEQRFKKAESEMIARKIREHEAGSSVEETADDNTVKGWRFNMKEAELEPVCTGAIITTGKNFDENGGISGTVKIPDEDGGVNSTVKIPDKNGGISGTVKIPDEDGGINGSVKIPDNNGGINGAVSSGNKIDDKNVGSDVKVEGRFDGEKELVKEIKELKEVMSLLAVGLRSVKSINSRAAA